MKKSPRTQQRQEVETEREELTRKKGKGEARKVSPERLGTVNQEADLET